MMSKVEVRLNGALGHCRCGAQTTKVIAVDGIPSEIALNGKMNIPFCDECFAKSALAAGPCGTTRKRGWRDPMSPSKNKNNKRVETGFNACRCEDGLRSLKMTARG